MSAKALGQTDIDYFRPNTHRPQSWLNILGYEHWGEFWQNESRTKLKRRANSDLLLHGQIGTTNKWCVCVCVCACRYTSSLVCLGFVRDALARDESE